MATIELHYFNGSIEGYTMAEDGAWRVQLSEPIKGGEDAGKCVVVFEGDRVRDAETGYFTDKSWELTVPYADVATPHDAFVMAAKDADQGLSMVVCNGITVFDALAEGIVPVS